MTDGLVLQLVFIFTSADKASANMVGQIRRTFTGALAEW